MWLLSTDRAELHFFVSSSHIDGGYAILSHTWGNKESTFQNLQELNEQCRKDDENPRDFVTPKIRNCCIVAERDGFLWVWIDTCCIDKTSSTELSEAINSMFRWYSESEVCYAFLEDVPSDDALDAPNSPFRRARWHTRGWTLQELIAPPRVIFVYPDHAGEWKQIGTRRALASLLHEITSIPSQVLNRTIRFHNLSIAERMSWASKRTTTRIEDEAYALMGLFRVNMPTIYGEGRQAFRRLQEEIMKQSFDSSLFAWGDSDDGLSEYQSNLPFSEIPEDIPLQYLLAISPRWFSERSGIKNIKFTPGVPQHGQPFGEVGLPGFSMTSYGVQCRFPVADLQDGYAVAILLCHSNGDYIGLLLHPSNLDLQQPTHRRYNVGLRYVNANGRRPTARLAFLGRDLHALTFKGDPIQAEWRSIHIADGPPPDLEDCGLSISYSLSCIEPTPPFRIPCWLIKRLESLGMDRMKVSLYNSSPNGVQAFSGSLMIDNTQWRGGFTILFGTCRRDPIVAGTPSSWAEVRLSGNEDTLGHVEHNGHDCSEHHIEAWPDFAKTFGDKERGVRLSFARCQFAPETTLVLHLELFGSAYEKLQRDKSIHFPPLAALSPRRSLESAAPT